MLISARKSARKSAVESDPYFSAAAQHNSKANDSFDSILPGLSDDVAKICLARVPRKHFPVMGAVCKRWRSFIQSKDFSSVRKETGMLEEWIYFSSWRFKGRRIHWEVMSSAKRIDWRIPPMPGSVNAGFSTVVLDGKLLIIGGYCNSVGQDDVSADVHQYDARLNSWSMLAKMKGVRRNFACCQVNRLIYAVGGIGSGGSQIMTAEVYDPDKNEWTLIEQLQRPRHDITGCSFGGKLYVIGGLTTVGFCTNVDIYSPDSRSWCKMTTKRSKMIMTHVVLGKKIYYIHSGDILIFDPADNSWREVRIPPPGYSGTNSRIGILGNKLLIFPLEGIPSKFHTLVYDPEAPPGSEWGRSALRAPCDCLGTVTIEA